MKNAGKSIKIILKASPYDFFMMVISLLIKFAGPILYTYSMMELFKEFPKIITGQAVDIKRILIFALALFIGSWHNIFYMRFYSTFVSMPRLERKLKILIHDKVARISSENLLNPMSDMRARRAIFAGTNLFRLAQTTMELIFTCLSGLSLVFILTSINIYIGLGLVIALVPTVISQVYETKLKVKNRDKKLEISRIKKLDEEAISGNPQFIESRTNYADEFFLDKYRDQGQAYKDMVRDEEAGIFKMSLGLFPLNLYADASALAINAYLLVIRKITFAGFGGSLAAFNNLKGQVLAVLSLVNYGRQFDAMVSPYFEFMNMGERLGSLGKPDGDIEFKNMSFKYPNAKDYALKNINLSIKPGEKIAIVGINGSGKTTLVRLLTGELLPTEGQVTYAGRSTRDIREGDMYDGTSQVNQFFASYAMTLRENIAFDTEIIYSEERLREFLKDDNLSMDDEMTRDFGGREMSGGQWQRLAILRGFNKPADLITLDEPTSAIDPLNEKEIYDFFYENSRDKTEVIVTHRLGAIKYVDRIIVMRDGEIVEDGDFESLIKRKGDFAKIYGSQLEMFAE